MADLTQVDDLARRAIIEYLAAELGIEDVDDALTEDVQKSAAAAALCERYTAKATQACDPDLRTGYRELAARFRLPAASSEGGY